jgi:hypothetical protein
MLILIALHKRLQLSMIKRDIKDAKKSKRILYSEFRKLINSSQEFTSMLGVKPVRARLWCIRCWA